MRKPLISSALGAVASLALAPAALADTLFVDDDGADCKHALPSINAAVAAAAPGDTILVCEGAYPEQVTVGKSDLRIMAKGPAGGVVLQGAGEPYGFGLVPAGPGLEGPTGVLVEGFTVRGYRDDIRLANAVANTIRNNVTTQATDHAGIFLDANSVANVVEHNVASTNAGRVGTGIRVAGATSARNVIRDNVAEGNACAGIQAGGGGLFPTPGPAGPDNEIVHNETRANGLRDECKAGGRGAGINNALTPSTLIAHNDVKLNEQVGILVAGRGSERVVIEHNRTVENGTSPTAVGFGGEGIRVNDPQGVDACDPARPGVPRVVCGPDTGNVVRYNESLRNGRAGIRVALARGTDVEHNVVDANGTQQPGVGIELGAALETTVLNNVSRDHRQAGYALRPGVVSFSNTPSTLNLVEDNVAKSNPGDGFLLVNGDDNDLAGNHSDRNGGDGIRVLAGSVLNQLVGNTMFSNLVDAEDENRPANDWRDNRCRTDLPAGTICETGTP